MNLPSPFESPRIRLVSTKLTVREPRVSYAVSTSAEAAKLLHRLIGACDREHFVALYLDARHKVTHAHVVSIGTMLSSIVHPREVFKAALLANAAAIIVGHNHPSGDVTPSSEDHLVAERLQEAGAVLGIELLDALVVGPGKRFYAKVTGVVQELFHERAGPVNRSVVLGTAPRRIRRLGASSAEHLGLRRLPYALLKALR